MSFDNDGTQASVCDSRLDAAPQEQAPSLSEKKNKSPLPYMLIRASVRSSMVAHPSAPSPSARSSGYHAVPVPHSWPRRPPSLTAPLTCVPITCVARSVAVHRPLPLDAQLTLPWPLGRTWHGALGLPRPSQGHPRAWPVLMVLARRRAPPDPTPTTGIDRPQPSPPLCCKCMCLEVWCNCYIWMLQKYIGMLHMLHIFASVLCGMF